ncbi:hypothetical protein ACLIKD_00710 [Azonexus sp. IMCC34842]|uniref:hypothetical protein n=1 Tax=Azonexus sp. IMCC34842 TaxID=3420950 RepID=UPI003D13680C
MKTNEDIERLEKLIGQLQVLHSEISQLAKKSPNDGLNLFKLKLVNKVLQSGNEVLTERYIPFDDFRQFEEGDLPTNSDVTMILAQYMEQTERFRSDHMIHHDYEWRYLINGVPSKISGRAPTKVGGDTR